MFKRCQILLTDWQERHYKLVAKKYDVSFSEMVRLALCLDTIFATKMIFPKYKMGINEKALKKAVRTKKIIHKMDMEKFHRFISKIYFESRKAAEFWERALKNHEK